MARQLTHKAQLLSGGFWKKKNNFRLTHEIYLPLENKQTSI